jgi:protease-4
LLPTGREASVTKRRGGGIVLGLVLAGVAASAAGLFVVRLLLAGAPAVPDQATLFLRIRGDLSETDPPTVIGPFLPTAQPTVRSVVDTLRRARTDDRIAALLVMPTGTPALWAKTQEVRDAILEFKTSGKPTVAWLEQGGDQEYYLATACDRVYLQPSSRLDLTGLASYDIFLRGTLDRFGVTADLLRVGDYKTAVNTWTEKGYTPAHREMAESLTRDTLEQLVRGIAQGRGKTLDEVRALVDDGPFLPEDALKAGLVDDLLYEDQLDDEGLLSLEAEHSIEADVYKGVGLPGLRLERGPRIAVVYAVGTISSGRSGESAWGPVLGSETLIQAIRTVRADDGVKAMVLRIDSPGGSGVASDAVWRELMLTRSQKPLVVSMSDLAASGGYYIALPGHALVAQPGTLTGSIGVYGGKFVVSGAFEKLGGRVEGVEAGRHAGMQSAARPYTDAERRKVEAQLSAFYDQFVEKVAQARHATPERIDALAQGRVWTGAQARALGLVDELGGLARAIELARERARIPPAVDVEIVTYPAKRRLVELVAAPWWERVVPGAPAFAALLRPPEREAAARAAQPVQLFRPGEPLALMPYVVMR